MATKGELKDCYESRAAIATPARVLLPGGGGQQTLAASWVSVGITMRGPP